MITWRDVIHFSVNGNPKPHERVEKTEEDLKNVWPKDEWNRRHLQIIFFGRELCPARNHDLKECPICSWAASKKRILKEAQSKK